MVESRLWRRLEGALHYATHHFFQLVTVSAILSDGEQRLSFTMVNDTAEDVEIDMNIVVLIMDGNHMPLKSINGIYTTDKAAALTDIDLGSLPEGAILA